MMKKSLVVSTVTHKRLITLKTSEEHRTVDDLIDSLLDEHDGLMKTRFTKKVERKLKRTSTRKGSATVRRRW